MKTIEELEIYAKEHYIPIARKALVSFLVEIVKANNYTKILECGSGIGYTSIQIALLRNTHVDTYEYYLPRYEICKQNIKDFNLEDKIALSSMNIMDAELDNDYDLIFIDGAKRHTIDLYEFLKTKIKDSGTIIVDNIDLDVVNRIEITKKRLKYERVAKETKEYFEKINDYNVEYMPIGDGIYKITRKV